MDIDTRSSDYSNLYHLLDSAQRDVEEESEEIEFEKERKRNRTKILAAESCLYEAGTGTTTTTTAGVGGKYLPHIEEFLTLVSLKLGVKRTVSDVVPGGIHPEVVPNLPEYLHINPSAPPSAPPSCPHSCSPTEKGDSDDEADDSANSSGSWVEDYSSGAVSSPSSPSYRRKSSNEHHEHHDRRRQERKVQNLEDELRKARQETREARQETRSLFDLASKPSFMPSYIPVIQQQAAVPQPIIINNNHNVGVGNKHDTDSYGETEKEVAKKKKKNAEKADRTGGKGDGGNEGLVRILAGLGALAIGAWGVYEMAKTSGREVNDEEIDAAARRAHDTLVALCRVNSVLKLSKRYQDLDRCVSLWQTYRNRVKKHESGLGYYKKLVWIPLMSSATTRALLPDLWASPSGDILTIGVSLVFGYGAFNWLYESIQYYYAYSSKDQWTKDEIKILVKQA